MIYDLDFHASLCLSSGKHKERTEIYQEEWRKSVRGLPSIRFEWFVWRVKECWGRKKKINKFTAQKYQIYSVSIIFAVYCRKAIKKILIHFPNTFTSNHKECDIFMKLFMNENCYALRNSSFLHFLSILFYLYVISSHDIWV